MPKYTFEIDGQKYTVTSDVQPTKEQLLELVKQKQKPSEPTIQPLETEQKVKQKNSSISFEESKKLTEEEIKKDPKWIEASKTIYEWDWQRKNPNKEIPVLSNEGYAEYGLEYGSGLAFSDVDLVREGQAIGSATDNQKQAFVNIMDMYDAKAPSLAGAGRAFKNILNPLESPTTY